MIPAMTEGSKMSTKKTIPIKLAGAAREEDVEDRLLREGWKRLTTIGEPRLSEIAENYRLMGYEVHVEYFDTGAAGDDGCTTCYEDGAASQEWGTVYVRQPASA